MEPAAVQNAAAAVWAYEQQAARERVVAPVRAQPRVPETATAARSRPGGDGNWSAIARGLQRACWTGPDPSHRRRAAVCGRGRS